MDIYIERIIKKQWTFSDKVRFFGLVLLALLVYYLALVLVGLLLGITTEIALLILLLVGSGLYYFAVRFFVEFEYSVTNGFVVVDSILIKRTRRRLVSFESRELQELGLYSSIIKEKHDKKSFDSVIKASSCIDPPNDWYAIFEHRSLGKTLLVFSPDERVLKAMKPFVSKRINSPIWRS
jgi:hypothetical protein